MRKHFGLCAELSQPQMVLRGNREVLVERCRGIAEYDEHHARLQFGNGQIELIGEELTLHSMSPDRVVVRGLLSSLHYLPADAKGSIT